MARPRPAIPQRTRMFIGTEGESEAAFAAFLRTLCDDEGLHVHFDIRAGSGGAPKSIFREALKQRNRRQSRGRYRRSICIMDRHEFDADHQNLEIRRAATAAGFDLILFAPNFEGLLLRLHEGWETRRVSPQDTRRELQRLWLDYRKPPNADDLNQRFSLPDLRRAAKHDGNLDRLLDLVGLL